MKKTDLEKAQEESNSMGNVFRQREYMAIFEIIDDYAKNQTDSEMKLTYEEKKTLARRIERSCHNSAINIAEEKSISQYWENEDFVDIYSNVGYQVKINLSPKSHVGDKYLITNIISYIKTGKGINPENLGFMKPEELCPSKSEKDREEIRIRYKQKIKKKTTEMYQCPNRGCRARNAEYEVIQTRSGDEGGTQFLTCVTCGQDWKIYL